MKWINGFTTALLIMACILFNYEVYNMAVQGLQIILWNLGFMAVAYILRHTL